MIETYKIVTGKYEEHVSPVLAKVITVTMSQEEMAVLAFYSLN